MTEYEAVELLRKYGITQQRIVHCIGVSRFAFSLANAIHQKNPELPVNPEKVKIAAVLHDIGRTSDGDHELQSVDILKKEGLDEYASIVLHGTIYEIMKLRGKDDQSLIPATLENKIVAYADSRFHQSEVTMEERWAEIEQRRHKESEKIKSLAMAKERFRAMEDELLKLAGWI